MSIYELSIILRRCRATAASRTLRDTVLAMGNLPNWVDKTLAAWLQAGAGVEDPETAMTLAEEKAVALTRLDATIASYTLVRSCFVRIVTVRATDAHHVAAEAHRRYILWP